MKLTIFNNGDPSVGIFASQHVIECLFEKENVEQEDLDFFKKEAIQLFAEFDSASYAMYDFEIEKENELIN